MNPNNLKHNKNNLKSKTLLAIIFSFILTMFFLSFQCNLFGGGDSGGIFIPPFSGGGSSSLSNPALSIDNTRSSFSSIFDGNYYYLLSRYTDPSTYRLLIHRISSDFSSISSKSFAFILSGSERSLFPSNILDTGSELITASHVSGAGADYHSAILKINKSSLSLQQQLFFNNTQIPRILFDNSSNHIYLSLMNDTNPSQGYLIKLDNNFNILAQKKTDPVSTYPDDIFLSSHTNTNLCGILLEVNPSGVGLSAGIFIISKSNLSSATKIPFTNYSTSTIYIDQQSPLITTESGNDYVYFADAVNSYTFHINKISVPPGPIASTQISLPSSSIKNININKINDQIVVGISKTESSINKLLFLIFDTNLNHIRSFELDVNNNQLFMYHRQKYFETPDHGFILTGDLNPSSYKVFFLKFNNLFNLTENNIFNVNNSPNVIFNTPSYTLPPTQTVPLSDTTLTTSTSTYSIQQNTWISNISTTP
jgi:hypothetical protein